MASARCRAAHTAAAALLLLCLVNSADAVISYDIEKPWRL